MADVLELLTLAMSGVDRRDGMLAALGPDTDVLVIGQDDRVFGCIQAEPADVERQHPRIHGRQV